MKLENILPILDQPAFLIKDKKILVISDLHIGIEEELKNFGINSGSQTKKILKKMIKICDKYKPKEIILLGDIKHNIPSSTYQERKDVKNFLEKIKELSKIHIIPGNHDGNISKICPNDIIIHPTDGMIVGDIAFTHGHKWPKKELINSKKIIIGHTHPTIMLTDRMNIRSYEPCFVKTNFITDKLTEKYKTKNNPDLFILPAFNSLCGGVALNKDGIVGPFSKIINIKKSKIFLLNGTYLGKVEKIT